MTKSSSKKGSIAKNKQKTDVFHTFQVKDYVFAKTVAHPPWPARIIKVKEDHIYRVDFIGVKYYADMYVTGLQPLNQKTAQNYLQVYDKNTKLKKSISTAMSRLQSQDRKSSKNNSSSAKQNKKTKKITKQIKSKKKQKDQSSQQQYENSSQNISQIDEGEISQGQENEQRQSKSYSHPPRFTRSDNNNKRVRDRQGLPIISQVESNSKSMTSKFSKLITQQLSQHQQYHQQQLKQIQNKQQMIYDEQQQQQHEQQLASNDGKNENQQNQDIETINYSNVQRKNKKMTIESQEEQQQEEQNVIVARMDVYGSSGKGIQVDVNAIVEQQRKSINNLLSQKSKTQSNPIVNNTYHENIITEEEEAYEERKIQNSPQIKFNKTHIQQQLHKSTLNQIKTIHQNLQSNKIIISPKRKPVGDSDACDQYLSQSKKLQQKEKSKKDLIIEEISSKRFKILQTNQSKQGIQNQDNQDNRNLQLSIPFQPDKSISSNSQSAIPLLQSSSSIKYRFFNNHEDEDIIQSQSSSSEFQLQSKKHRMTQIKDTTIMESVNYKKSRRATQLLVQQHRKRKQRLRKLKLCDSTISWQIKFTHYSDNLYQYQSTFNNTYQCTFIDKSTIIDNLKMIQQKQKLKEIKVREESNNSFERSMEGNLFMKINENEIREREENSGGDYDGETTEHVILVKGQERDEKVGNDHGGVNEQIIRQSSLVCLSEQSSINSS